jgi:serine phosphatase RsbU (regulator of sigma subunit)
VLYTDGLTEAGAPARTWSDAELAAAASATAGRSAQDTVRSLVDAALGPVDEPRDDVAVLALRVLG